MEPYLLDLSALHDHGASILDLDDGEYPATIPALLRKPTGADMPVITAGFRWIEGERARELNVPRDRVWDYGHLRLDCRRPSIQAHLCRWLSRRITGQVHACLLYRQGSLWILSIAGDQQPIAVWSKGWRVSNYDGARNCPDLRDQDEDGEAIAALVRAHA